MKLQEKQAVILARHRPAGLAAGKKLGCQDGSQKMMKLCLYDSSTSSRARAHCLYAPALWCCLVCSTQEMRTR